MLCLQLKLTLWMVTTAYAIYKILNLSALLLVSVNVIMLILIAILGKNVLCYVLCFGVVVAAQTTDIANKIFGTGLPETVFAQKKYLLIVSLCYLNARGLSATLDNLTTREKEQLQSSRGEFFEKLLTIAAYLLYLPGFFTGPIYIYDDFEKTVRSSERPDQVFISGRYLKIMLTIFKFITNVLLYEWMLHWLYSSAVAYQPLLLNNYDSWQLSGFGFSLCILFFMKYRCIYSFFKLIASLDGNPSISPPMPQCVAVIHRSSHLWRYFDVGLYRWLIK